MSEVLYWIWLQDILGGGAKVDEIIDYFHTPENVFKAEESVLRGSGISSLKKRKIDEILKHDLSNAKEIYDLCLKHKIHILIPSDRNYPTRLLSLPDYPLVLYVRGDYICLNAKDTFAVIGSRTPSLYGEKAARRIVASLCKHNCVIVSGGALGLDSIAHMAAIESSGKTILVQGCGLGYNYLSVNSELRKKVCFNGALVSEYPPLSPVLHNSFPMRNRIISGLSKGVIICEAAENSGTFSTAKHALKQGRDLFVLPGDIESGNFTGSNQLISGGAKAIFSGEEVLEFYSGVSLPRETPLFKDGNPFPDINVDATSTKKKRDNSVKAVENETDNIEEKTESENIVKINPESISKNALIVYNIVSKGVNELDDIVRETSLEVRKVLVSLTELEMQGYVHRNGPNKYCLK